MNLEEYKERLESLGIEKNDYVIISGGVMLFNGLKESTEDVDIMVKPEVFKKLKENVPFKKSPKYNYLYEMYDDVEVAVEGYNDNCYDVIDGYKVEKLEIELKWKKENKRKKDIEAIKIIENYLNRKG